MISILLKKDSDEIARPNLGAECGGITSLSHPALQSYNFFPISPKQWR